MDLTEIYDQATAWTAERVAGAQGHLDSPTPCREWTVRQLLDHLLWGQAMFATGLGSEAGFQRDRVDLRRR